METSNAAEALDRTGAEPLHAQVSRAIRADIATRQLPPGTPLPSEAALCRRFGVARSVVRQALAGLAAEGVIRREPGRAPVVAAPREHRRLVQRSAGLYDQMADLGVILRTQVLTCQPADPPPEVAEFFGSADTVLLERLRSVDDAPLAYVRTWLPRAVVEGRLSAEDLRDASLHRLLAARCGLQAGRGRNRIRAVAADAHLARMLGVGEGSPLLMLEGRGLDQHQRPLEWFTTWHRPEHLVFDVDVGSAQEQVQPSLPPLAAVDLAAAQEPGVDAAAPSGLDAVEQALRQALAALQRHRNESAAGGQG